MKDTSYEALKENILKDIESCSKKDLDKIYSSIKLALKEFDRDGFLKNCKDIFKSLFKSKKRQMYFIHRRYL